MPLSLSKNMLSWYRKDLKVACCAVLAGNCFYCAVMNVPTGIWLLLFRHSTLKN